MDAVIKAMLYSTNTFETIKLSAEGNLQSILKCIHTYRAVLCMKTSSEAI